MFPPSSMWDRSKQLTKTSDSKERGKRFIQRKVHPATSGFNLQSDVSK